MTKSIQVGFGREDITPEEYTTLSGLGNDSHRVCNQILDRLSGTCIAIRDAQGETVLLCTLDLLLPELPMMRAAKAAMTAATGIPNECILFTTTHTHSGPSMYDLGDGKIDRYFAYVAKKMARAAVSAIEDLAPAQIQTGQKMIPNMTFVRRYLLKDGTFVNRGWGYDPNDLVHMDESDDQLQVIRFVRENARDIVLVNWQSHSTITSDEDRYDMSADYPGTMRNHLEGMLGCYSAFFQGASGNLVPFSQKKEEMIVEHDHILYGRKLAEFVKQCLEENMKPVETGAVKVARYEYTAQIDHSDDYLVPKAQELKADYWERSPEERKLRLKELGFNSVYHANFVCWRAEMEMSETIVLTAVSVGDISFAAVPYEMFNSNGRFIKDNTPFAITFIMALCNGYYSYIADQNAFRYDCYEVNTRRYGEGVAEDIAQTFVNLLNGLKGESEL